MKAIIDHLRRDDFGGACFRLVGLVVLLLMVLLLVIWMTPRSASSSELPKAFVLVLLCSAVGHFAGEYPKGDRWVLMRLTGPIWTRTGLLLLFLLAIFNRDLLNRAFINYILTFYLTGLAADVVLACLRNGKLNSTDSPVA